MTPLLVETAWVPFAEDTTWDDDAAVAIAWIERRCAAEKSAGLLITPALQQYGEPLDSFAATYGQISTRSRRRPEGTGPVLVYVPRPEDLDLAQRQARGSSVAAIETPEFPLAGWAAYHEALDLNTGRPTPPLPDDVREQLDRLVWHGNNGYASGFGRDRAEAILEDLAAAGQADPAVVPSAGLAAGLSPPAVKQLAKMVDQLT